MRLALPCVVFLGILLLWILSHFFLYTTNWNETSYLIGFDSVSGSVRLKLGRAIGGAKSGSYTEADRLEPRLDSRIEVADETDIFGGPALVRSPLTGTFTGNSDFLRPFEIESNFDTFKSFNLMVTIPYWLVSVVAMAFVVLALFHQTRTEQADAGKPDPAAS